MTMITDRGIAPGTATAPKRRGAPTAAAAPKRSSFPGSRIRVIRTYGYRPCWTSVLSS